MGNLPNHNLVGLVSEPTFRRRFNSSRQRSALELAISMGLALLIVTALLLAMGNATPAGANQTDLYVDGASGQDNPTCGSDVMPCQTISYTLNTRAADGDAILIAQGIYPENLTISAITITLRGGYAISGTVWIPAAGETVVDGNDTARVFSISDSYAVLDYLTITGGRGSSGGGIRIDGGYTLISNAIISGNISTTDGGGLAAYGGAVELQDVEVANNRVAAASSAGHGGGLYFRNDTQATISRVHLHGNTAAEGGGAIHLDDAPTVVTIDEALVENNTALGAQGAGGGGLGVHQGGIMTIANSTIAQNHAPNNFGGGIHVWEGGTLYLIDCLLTDNTAADHGGAITVYQATAYLTNALITGNETTADVANVLAIGEGNVTIVNSTVAGNNPQGAQAVILWSGLLTITNSIMWNNALNLQADPPCPSCFAVTYSNIAGGWPGTGNIDSDPLFQAAGDYHLQGGSPSIDTGTNTGAPDHDLDHNPRPRDGDFDGTPTTDMGAYEFQAYRILLPAAFNLPAP